MNAGKKSSPKLIVVSGATATGKTRIALALGKMCEGEIVNFDSLQFYKDLIIGTALPSQEERSSMPHHLFAFRDIREPLNAADFGRLALPVIDDILARQKTPILVGGSGFYLKALLQGMYESPTTPPEIIARSRELYQKEGIAPFWKILENADPANFKRLHPNDHYRIMRAVEHWWNTGTPFSAAQEQKESILLKDNTHGWNVLHLNLQVEKEQHWQLMETRVRQMIAQGLIDEVRNILAAGYSPQLRPLRAIGYKETVDFLEGKIHSEEELIQSIFVNTRQLAKSQKTWFATVPNKMSFTMPADEAKILEAASVFFAS